MHQKRTAFLLTAALGLSCSQQTREPIPSDKSAADVLRLILNNHEFKPYLHQELAERSPILIATNNLIPTTIDISNYTMHVELHPSQISAQALIISQFTATEKGISFTIIYNTEGVIFSGMAVKEGTNWKLTKVSVIES